jgi:hypothetical protein
MAKFRTDKGFIKFELIGFSIAEWTGDLEWLMAKGFSV